MSSRKRRSRPHGWPRVRRKGDRPTAFELDSRDFDRESLSELGRRLERQGSMALILVDATPLRGIDVEHGKELHNGIVHRILEVVSELESRSLPGEAPFFLTEEDRDSILLFVSPERSRGAEGDDELRGLFERLTAELDKLLRQFPSLGRRLRLPVGRAVKLHDIGWQGHGQVLELIRRARPEFEHHVTAEESALTHLLAREDIETMFQPIVELETHSIVGLEALSRGPRGSPFETPSALFACAERVGLLAELVRACWRCAIAASRGIPSSRKVFLKVLASSFEDPELCGPPLFQRIAEASVEPEQIVLEISERLAVFNYARLQDQLHSLRVFGVRAAVDNLGSGYSGLDVLVELNTEYAKLHASIVVDCHLSDVKREMIQTIQAMADKRGTDLIAHGVQKSEELRCLRDLGIRLGQGFLFGRPGAVPLSAANL